jgi:hypothetical protein
MIEDKNFQFFKTPVTFQKVIALIKKYTKSSLSNKGYYADEAALEAAFPTGEAGWYAIVGSTDTVWIWDAETTAWVNSGTSGSGDVVGASSSTYNAVARYNSTTGKVIKNSTVIIDDSGNITGINNLSASGNFTISGLAKKIFGDFSNATRANRVAVQTTTTNGNTRLPLLPNGTSRLAGIDCHDGADADNSSFLQVHSDGTNNHAGLNSAKIGTGITKDLVFQIDAVTKAQINASDGKFKILTLTASRNVTTDASGNLQTLAEANYASLSGAITATETNRIAVYEFTGAGSLVLPTAVGNTAIFMVKNRHTANITVTFTGGQNADGSTSILITPYQALQFISNNANYNIF